MTNRTGPDGAAWALQLRGHRPDPDDTVLVWARHPVPRARSRGPTALSWRPGGAPGGPTPAPRAPWSGRAGRPTAASSGTGTCPRRRPRPPATPGTAPRRPPAGWRPPG